MKKHPQQSFFASLFGRSSTKKSTKTRAVVVPTPHPFQSISIHKGMVCCVTAKKVDGYRFLVKNAPQLPLSECTMPAACKCRYEKYDDRRSGARRSSDIGLKQVLFAAEEQRRSKGRRKKDQ